MEVGAITTPDERLRTLRALNAILDYASLDAEDIGADALVTAIDAARKIAIRNLEEAMRHKDSLDFP